MSARVQIDPEHPKIVPFGLSLSAAGRRFKLMGESFVDLPEALCPKYEADVLRGFLVFVSLDVMLS